MLSILLKHWKLLALWGIIFAVAALGTSFLFPLKYSADSQLLLISRGYTGIDPYTQAKAAERVGENLAQVVQTSDFYNKVMEIPAAAFNKEFWQSMNERDQRKAWLKDVQAQVVYDTALIRVTAYATTQQEALALSDAVSQTLASRGWEYVGGDVVLKLVNAPLASRFYAKPNFLLNAAAGFALGILFAAWWVIKRKHHLFGKL